MKKIGLLIFPLLTLLFVIYVVSVNFSESREYSRVSLDYYLLTPVELTELSGHCKDNARFIYSAADGPKPAIIHLYCTIEERIITGYANKSNFYRISNSQFKKGPIEIEVEKNNSGKVTRITIYEYLLI